MTKPNRVPSTRERVLGRVLAVALGVTAVAGSFWAGLGLGRNMNSERVHDTTPYALSTVDLEQLYAHHSLQIDPHDQNNQFFFGAYDNGDDAGAADKGWVALYVSIDGGVRWASIERPAANGINKDETTQVYAASFAPAQDTNPALHAPGTEFEVTYLSQRGREISTELAVADAYGITQVDTETTYGVIPAYAGVWTYDGHGSYSYSLPLTDGQDQPLKPLQVSEPHNAK